MSVFWQCAAVARAEPGKQLKGATGAKPPPQLPSGCRGDVPRARRGDLGRGTVPAPRREVLIHGAEPPAGEGDAALAPAAGCSRWGWHPGSPGVPAAERAQ